WAWGVSCRGRERGRWAWWLSEGEREARGEAAGVALILGVQGAGVSLHHDDGVSARAVDLAVDVFELALALVEAHLESGDAGRVVRIGGTPFDIEDAVGGRARNRGRNA